MEWFNWTVGIASVVTAIATALTAYLLAKASRRMQPSICSGSTWIIGLPTIRLLHFRISNNEPHYLKLVNISIEPNIFIDSIAPIDDMAREVGPLCIEFEEVEISSINDTSESGPASNRSFAMRVHLTETALKISEPIEVSSKLTFFWSDKKKPFTIGFESRLVIAKN